MILRSLSISVFLAPAAIAHAEAPASMPVASMSGKFAFGWSPKAKCKAVDAKRMKELEKGFACTAADPNVGTSSGKPLFAECKATKGKRALLVFSTMADCNEEYETQQANE